MSGLATRINVTERANVDALPRAWVALIHRTPTWYLPLRRRPSPYFSYYYPAKTSTHEATTQASGSTLTRHLGNITQVVLWFWWTFSYDLWVDSFVLNVTLTLLSLFRPMMGHLFLMLDEWMWHSFCFIFSCSFISHILKLTLQLVSSC